MHPYLSFAVPSLDLPDTLSFPACLFSPPGGSQRIFQYFFISSGDTVQIFANYFLPTFHIFLGLLGFTSAPET